MSNSMLFVLFTLIFDDLTIVTVLWKKIFWRFNCWLFSDFLLPLLERGHIPSFHLVTAMPVNLILDICKIFLNKHFLKRLPRLRISWVIFAWILAFFNGKMVSLVPNELKMSITNCLSLTNNVIVQNPEIKKKSKHYT